MDGRCVKHVYIFEKNEFDVIVQYSGRLSEDYSIFLVHYIAAFRICFPGNLDIATKRPHGNCKMDNAHLFHRTTASTIEQIDQLVSTMPGATAYKTLVGASSSESVSRHAAQCQYRRQKN